MTPRGHRLFSSRRRFLGFLALLPWSLKVIAADESAKPPEIPDVPLMDSAGTEHRLPELLAQGPVIISFFYTRCTSFCPMQTALMRNVQAHLRRRHAPGLLLSISLDPSNDTPAALAAYAAKFRTQVGLPQQWLLLTGEEPALTRVWRAFDSATGRPEEHAATLWIGCAAKQRWSRQFGLPGVQQLMAAMRAVSA